MTENKIEMSWSEQLSFLRENVQIAKKNLRNATGNITVVNPVLNSEGQKKQAGCINVFKAICYTNGQEYTPFVAYCRKCKIANCENTECYMYPKNLDYKYALKRLQIARAIKREFWKDSILGLFK